MKYERQALLKGTNNPQQLLYCVVLEPDSEDLQGDVISCEDIEKAAHRYAIESRVVSKGHVKNGKGYEEPVEASVVETFIAPVDFSVGDGEIIRKGSWVMAVKVHDQNLWYAVERGEIDGLSIGGLGERVPM